MFYEKYLEYENITSLFLKILNINNTVYCKSLLILIGVIFDPTRRRV